MHALVNTATVEFVQFTTLERVAKPGGQGVFAFCAQPGDTWGDFKVLAVSYVDDGDGPRLVSTSAPVFDGEAVTVTRTYGPALIPQSVTPLQARKALRAAGMKSAVDAWLATQTEEVQEAWDYALEVRRDDATVLAAQAALELTDVQMDDLFTLAATM